MKSSDILASGGVWGHFSSIFGALGVRRMTLDVQCPLLIDFWWLWGLKMGAFGILNVLPGRSWAYFCDTSGQK